MPCFNRFWYHQVVKIRASQWNSTFFETVDCRIFDNGSKIQGRFGHKWASNSSCRTAYTNPAGQCDLRACKAFSMCAVVRTLVVCVTFYVLLQFASHLLLTCFSLDLDIISPPKHITTHLNPHLICTNIHTCALGSLVARNLSIRSKKKEKSKCDMRYVVIHFTFFFLCSVKAIFAQQ